MLKRTAVAVAIALSSLWSGPGQAAPTTFRGVQPQLASNGSHAYLAFGLENTIHVARSDDAGETFGRPVPLPVTGRLALGRHRGPRIAVTSSTVLATAVIGATGGGADGDVLLYRSTDRGATWTAPTVINDGAGAAREGLHAMAANAAGLVVVAWLDLGQAGTRVQAAISRDHGATWTPDILVYASRSGSVCECCHPSIAIDSRGAIAVMFRNNLDGNRDMYVARSDGTARFDAAVKVGTGSWALNACPMDGGGIGFGANGLVTAWRRDTSVFFSTTQTAERRLGPGRDPALAVSGSHYDIAWTSPAGLQLARDGAQPITISAGQFPALLALPDKTILAFENQGAVEFRALRR